MPPMFAWEGRPFFAGETEACINGRVVSAGAYFGQDVQVVVDRLLGEQMADGGWNCELEIGSTRGSFNSTINVLEGLLEHERATGGSPAVAEARRRGEEYLLERRLFRRLSTGEVINPDFLSPVVSAGIRLRHSSGARLLPSSRRCARRTRLGGGVAPEREARRGRPMEAGKTGTRRAGAGHGRAGWRAQPMGHAAGDARSEVG